MRVSCAAAMALFAGESFAGDLSAAPYVKAEPLGYDWTGFYIGGHIGLAAGHSNWTLEPLGGGVPAAGSFGLYRSPNAFTEGGSYFEGVQAGYNLMLRNRVLLGI